MIDITFTRATNHHNPQVKNPFLRPNSGFPPTSNTNFLDRLAFLYVFLLAALFYLLRLLNHSS